jgi:hypothetical protein
MAPRVDISMVTHGEQQLRTLAAAIKAAGGKEFGREVDRAMRRAARPLTRSARQGAMQVLPYRGGLAERVARSRFTAAVRNRGASASLTIRGSGRYNLNRMDEGTVRHPVYADTRKTRREWAWVNQRIRPGWFTDPLLLDAPKVRNELEDAMDDLGRRLLEAAR